MGQVGHEKDLFISIFPIERQEFRQIPLVTLVVWDLSQHVLHPGPGVNVGSLAGAYEQIYDCCTIRRCVIATEQIVRLPKANSLMAFSIRLLSMLMRPSFT